MSSKSNPPSYPAAPRSPSRGHSVSDAIPTQEEGDALFDELFGSGDDEADATNEYPAQLPSAPPLPPGAPAVVAEAAKAEALEPFVADDISLGEAVLGGADADDDDAIVFDDEVSESGVGNASEVGGDTRPLFFRDRGNVAVDFAAATTPSAHTGMDATDRVVAAEREAAASQSGDASGGEFDGVDGLDEPDGLATHQSTAPIGSIQIEHGDDYLDVGEEVITIDDEVNFIDEESIDPNAVTAERRPPAAVLAAARRPDSERPVTQEVVFDDDATATADGVAVVSEMPPPVEPDELDTLAPPSDVLDGVAPREAVVDASADTDLADGVIEVEELTDDIEDLDDLDDSTEDSTEVEEPAAAAAPPPPPRRSAPDVTAAAPAVAFDEPVLGDGVDAVVTLLQQGERDGWLARAEWLLTEAPASDPPEPRAQALLVVSELFAMAGDNERAVEIAREALDLSPASPLASRQLRGLLANAERWDDVSAVLDAEARVAYNVDAKVHAAYLGAEVARVKLGDASEALRRLEQVERAAPDDIRPQLDRLMRALAAADEPVTATFRGPAAEALTGALAMSAVMRSDGAGGQAHGSAFASILRARHAASRRNVAGVIDALDGLQGHEELEVGAAWLSASLAAPHAAQRERALTSLRFVAAGSHGVEAARAGISRALEGASEELGKLVTAADPQTLSAPERVTLSALAGESDEDLVLWLGRCGQEEAFAPLAAAAAATLFEVGSSDRLAHDLGGDEQRAAAALGRELWVATQANDALVSADGEDSEDSEAGAKSGVVSAGLRARSQDVLDERENHGVGRALLLEHAYEEGNAAGVAAAIASAAQDDVAFAERVLAAALIAEASGDVEQRNIEAARAVEAAPYNEAALRLALTDADAASSSELLMRHAEGVEDAQTRALTMVEAGLRLLEVEGQAAAGQEILQRAAEVQPDEPIASFIGMYLARALGDIAAEQQWVEHRRSAAAGPVDAAPDLIRRALTLGDDDAVERASLLEEAHRAYPNDYPLRDLLERASDSSTRADWLAERLAQGGGSADAALEAALLHELAGDFDKAAPAASQAVTLGDEQLAPLFVERYGLMGHGTAAVVESLESRARATEDAAVRGEINHRVAELALRGMNDRDKAIGALRACLRDGPDDVAALLGLAELLLSSGNTEGLAEVVGSIATVLDDAEGTGHAVFAATLVQRSKGWQAGHAAVKAAFKRQASPWVKRQMADYARSRDDHPTAAGIDLNLAEHAEGQLDQVTLSLRSAEERMASGDDQVASELLGEVLSLRPTHHVAALLRATLLERTAGEVDAAQAYEALAALCQAPHSRATYAYKAATLWLASDDADAQIEGRRLLEAVTDIDADYQDAFDRLQSLYLATGAKRELAELLAARIVTISDPEERLKLEVMRGKMLIETGSAAEAREALSAALEAHPDNPEALLAYADVCAAEEDWAAAEQSLVRLGRLVSEPAEQCAIYLRLGRLYDQHMPNPERAEQAYQQVLRLDPGNIVAQAKLVDLFIANGDAERAFELQNQLLEAAESASEKCTATVRLAEIHETSGDLKTAEKMLVRARRTWSKEARTLNALYGFHRRNGQEKQADTLLERASADVRRGLGAGRFEEPLFAMAVSVAELRGDDDAASIAQATLHALKGEPASMAGAGDGAGNAALNDQLAPQIFSPSFRELLMATGGLMELAAPFDMQALRAKPLTPNHAAVAERAQALAAAHGLPELRVVATSVLGSVCVPAALEPPTICFGVNLLTSDRDDLRDFLVHRALKVLQTRTAALARTAPIDLWPLLAAYLKVHQPSFQPVGVDSNKLRTYHDRMAASAPSPMSPRLTQLTADIIGSIGNRASSLNVAANSWGTRTGLLASGDPGLAIEAVGWAHDQQEIPLSGRDRVRWISRQAEARDLIVFSVSSDYSEVRKALGINGSALAEEIAVEELELLDDDFVEVE